ncbi:MAG: LytTR family transcriptional regulator [Bacteroidales bacterium]|nr:LytTR family transcriptional regulator [Bacteroidales bacterium]
MDVPKLYLSRGFLYRTVLYDVLFSIGFLVLYKPFSSTFWLSVSSWKLALASIAFYLACIVFLLASRELLYRFQKKHEARIKHIAIWTAAELAGLAVIYLLFTSALGYSTLSGPVELLLRTAFCVALILVFPFLIAFMYATIQDKKEEIRLLQLNITENEAQPEIPMVHLYDHSGALKISAAQDDIFYIMSQDNYVSIHYLIGNDMNSYLLRCSTIQVEEALKGTSIMRCHRSYLVNLNHVKMLKHSSGKAVIVLSDNTGTQIPVSRNYYKELRKFIVPEKIIKST